MTTERGEGRAVCARRGWRRPAVEQRRAPSVYGRAFLVSAAVLAVLEVLPSPAGAALTARARAAPAHARSAAHSPCPWIAAAEKRHFDPARLASEVVDRMTLSEKLAFVVLVPRDGYENSNAGVPRLCIRPLTLQDGPNGIAYDARGVTQLPSSLALAASFDTSLAYDYGRVLGSEARGKGIDAVQGPNLNLLRVPTSGRAFEGYGEDPYLVGQMGVADIQGIQSEHVMADAKHYTAYNQETARVLLNQVVSQRALYELYLAPFAAAVEQGHVASIMCAYGSLNGVNTCSDPKLYSILQSWGFKGFVRSDLGAVLYSGPAFRAGMDLIKPASESTLRQLVDRHVITIARLDDAVRLTLGEMFAFGLAAHPLRGTMVTKVDSAAHADFAVTAAERSMVLLKDRRGILPLSRSVTSIAVIGTSGGRSPTSVGYGSARVVAAYVASPLGAIRRSLPRRARVTYVPGGPSVHLLPPIPSTAFVAGTALPPMPRPDRPAEPGKGDLGVLRTPGVTRAVATASRPGSGGDWSSWSATIVAPSSGLYDISLAEDGDTWLYVDGRALLSFPGLHGRSSWSATITLRRGHRYHLRMLWYAVDGAHNPRLGWVDVSPMIHAAVVAARRARIAVVFASDFSSEGVDRPTLALPGDENALIAAVAAANPRTVVVLDTGGAVLMPWLDSVRAVLEAWYPGQGDGTATAAVLFGKVDPSGRLPVTFPVSDSQIDVTSPAAYPGVDATVDYSENLDVGYRYVEAHDLVPLFPFGFGLDYTTFGLSDLQLSSKSGRDTLAVDVVNTGQRRGTEVVQAYLSYPPSAGEPPSQLRAFTTVSLAPGASATVHLELPRSAFEAYLGGSLRTVSGPYIVRVGDSSANLPLALTTAAP